MFSREIQAEYIPPKVKRRYRRQPRFDIGEGRPRLGISEQEVQASLHPKPRRILVLAAATDLIKRADDADTSRPMTKNP